MSDSVFIRKKLPYSHNNRILRVIMLLIAATLVADSFVWGLDLKSGSLVRVFLWLCHLSYFTLTEVISYLWLLYVMGFVLENRSAAKRRRQSAWAGDAWCLILMDVDSFKHINDLYGHPAGDEALRQVAAVLKKTFGKTDAFLARYGGDEFAVVLEGANKEEIEQWIVQACMAVRNVYRYKNHRFSLSLSAGYAMYNRAKAADPVRLVSLADQRMYADKNSRKASRVTLAE